MAVTDEIYSRLVRTMQSYFRFGTLRLKDSSGTLQIRNGADSADAGLKTSALQIATFSNGALQSNASGVLSSLAPGASGNVLTSDGTDWTSAAPSGGSGAMTELVPRTTLGGSAASIDLTSIPPDHHILKLFLYGRTDRAGASNDSLRMRFNADSTAANYYGMFAQIFHSATVATGENIGAASNLGPILAGATATANYHSIVEITIINYAITGKPRYFMVDAYVQFLNTTGNLRRIVSGGLWTNTADVIDEINLLSVNSANFVTGTTYALFGIGAD